MRKAALEEIRSILETGSIKQQVTLDDHSIRELLRNAYPEVQEDIQENISESQMTIHSEEALFLPFLYRNENEYIDSAHLHENPNISLFWKLFIQRHIISFEQESMLFMNWHRNRIW